MTRERVPRIYFVVVLYGVVTIVALWLFTRAYRF